MPNHHELVVIGGGSAGLTCVQEALLLGCKDIALIEKEVELGGSCAHYACVPTKTLLSAAGILKHLKTQAHRSGLQVQEPSFSMKALAQTVTAVIHEKSDTTCHEDGVHCYRGEAKLTGSQSVSVDGQVITGDKIIIATGSRPRVPNIEGLEDIDFWTYKQASRLTELPKSMMILGGNVVGVEFAQLFQLLGCQVTLFEQTDRLVGKEEPEISALLAESLKRDGVNIQLESEAVKFARNGALTRLITKEGKTFDAERLLLATGVEPILEELNLEFANVKFDKKRGIIVDAAMRTSNASIYAVGDSVGPYRLTNTADYQAVIATRNALRNEATPVDYRAVAWAIYTIPTLAHVGLTESEAREKFTNIQVITARPEEVSRYRIEGQTEGFIKLIVDADTDCLVGGHIMAEQADDMAHYLMLAIHARLPIPTFQDLAFIYPAKAQLIQKAIEKYQSASSGLKLKNEQAQTALKI